MVWQSYDHQKIILNESMAEQFSRYLESKEAQLSAKIIDVISQLEGFPLLKETSNPSLRLSEAVEEFGRKINAATQSPQKNLAKYKWKLAAKQINHALWNYVEVLEGCVIEFFQQIDQMGFEQWNEDAVRTVTYIRDELTNRMDDLIWTIRQLEKQLESYQNICEDNRGRWFAWHKVVSLFSPLLDRALEPNVRKSNKYLNFRYHKFLDQYAGYLQLCETSQQSVNKFYQYPVLSSMEVSQQEKLKELYFLLNLWENNSKSRVLPRTEPVRALRSCLSFENTVSLFKEYFFLIREAVFDKSRLIKKQFRLMFLEQESRQALVNNLANYRTELETLKGLLANYMKFHLQTDPDSKSWFSKLFRSDVGKELSKHFKELRKLTDEVGKLDVISRGFQASLESKSNVGNTLTTDVKNEINRHLHEMGQPLASKDLMRRHAKALIHSLQSLDEISSFEPEVVDVVSFTLCKAMCADWKYHVLQEIPSFHEVYDIHQGVFSTTHERVHSNRYYKFQRILKQLEMWIKNGETLKRAQEMDLDINDIKAYLQDFLAYVQRLEPEDEHAWENERFERPSAKAANVLLQYLYLFGNFFSQFNFDDSEHRLIRKKLLFIDQYFEAIDRRIQELTKS